VPEVLQWIKSFNPFWGVAILSVTPAVELSGSIPYGLIATKLPVGVVVLTALLANWLVAPAVFLFMRLFTSALTRVSWFARLWTWYTERVIKRVHGFMERWGSWGLLVFIAVPGPGSGLYTCSVAAYLLGVDTRRFVLVALVGQLIAAAIVTFAVLSGSAALQWAFEKGFAGG
jgi:uncharacterized membrane protein